MLQPPSINDTPMNPVWGRGSIADAQDSLPNGETSLAAAMSLQAMAQNCQGMFFLLGQRPLLRKRKLDHQYGVLAIFMTFGGQLVGQIAQRIS